MLSIVKSKFQNSFKISLVPDLIVPGLIGRIVPDLIGTIVPDLIIPIGQCKVGPGTGPEG